MIGTSKNRFYFSRYYCIITIKCVNKKKKEPNLKLFILIKFKSLYKFLSNIKQIFNFYAHR